MSGGGAEARGLRVRHAPAAPRTRRPERCELGGTACVTDPARRTADRALRIARDPDVAPAHRVGVEQQEAPRHRLADATDELHRFGGLRRADDADDRREDAHDRAARFLELFALAEQAVVAGRGGIPRVEDRDLAVEADRRAGDERRLRGDAGAVHGMPGREIVAAVEHDIGARHEGRQFGRPDPGLHRLDAHFRVDGGEPRLGGGDLRRSDIRRRVEDLPLEVREVHRVRVA